VQRDRGVWIERSRAWPWTPYLALALVVVLGVALRLVYLWELSHDVWLRYPVIDEQLNAADARYLREESWLGPPEPYWKPPLYAYVLAVLGDGWGARLGNVVLDAASCVLVWSVGARLWSPRVGLVAATIVALDGALVFFTGQLVSTSLVVFLHLLALRAVLWAWDRAHDGAWLAVGAACGVLALARAEGLLLAVAAMLAAGWRGGAPVRARSATIVGLGLWLTIAPVTLRNVVRGGDAVLISANGGINLYIGTAPEHGGVVGVRPCHAWEKLVREPASVGVDRPGSAHSTYFVRQAARRVVAAPGTAARHWAGKLVAYWHGYELPSNRDIYAASRSSAVLRALVWRGPPLYAPWGLLAPAALVGMALVVARRHRAWPIVVAVGLLCLVTTVFFVTARFRAPAIPLLALFAASAGETAVCAWRHGNRRALALGAAGFAALVALLNHPGVGAAGRERYRVPLAAEEHHFRGTILFAELDRPREAARELEQAAALEPRCAQTRLNLAQARLASGDEPGALFAVLAYLDVVDRYSPGERIYEGDAIAVALRALAQASHVAASPVGRGLERLLAGDAAAAVDALSRVGPEAGALLSRALRARAAVALAQGDAGAALADVERALARWPDDADAHLLAALAELHLGRRAAACERVARFRTLEWPRGAFERRARTDGDRLAVEALGLLDACRRR
jgi:4-amino-4-deoxy-L-arabinose transferase-like glycosyltransferase